MEAINICTGCNKPCEVTEWCNSVCCAEPVTEKQRETQATIAAWCETTFGPATPYRIASRALEELAECIAAIERGDPPAKIAEEAADTIICLTRLFVAVGLEMDLAPIHAAETHTPRRWALWAAGKLLRVMTLIDAGWSLDKVRPPLHDLVAELATLAEGQGVKLVDAIVAKMTVLRERKWVKDGSGCGYHVKEVPA